MGIKRVVDTAFWTDGKVDEFSPEDKYFMLYLLTNPFTKQLGIYEFSIKQAAFQMGYSVDAFNVLLERFEKKYNIIRVSKETNEIAILNFLKHSVIKGGKPVEDCIRKEMARVKNKNLIDCVFAHLYEIEGLNETVKKIVNEYKNENNNEIQNDNDNDNERTVGVSYHDSFKVVVDLFNSLCPSFPSVQNLSEERIQNIQNRLHKYSIDDLKRCFEKAEASSFLKGKNKREWSATFDWIIQDSNVAKILDGNFDDKISEVEDFFNVALQRSYSQTDEDDDEPPKTLADDEQLRERAEALIRQLGTNA